MDLLEDPDALRAWRQQAGYATTREAVRVLQRVAEPLLAADAPLLESKILRYARAAHAEWGPDRGSRDDVEALCDFVERAGQLPLRVQEVFGCCATRG